VSEQFLFQLQNHLIYGIGRSRELGAFLRERGIARVLLAVDEGVVRQSAYYREILGSVAQVAEVVVETLRGSEEPDYDYLDEVASKLRRSPRPELLLGIGGGT